MNKAMKLSQVWCQNRDYMHNENKQRRVRCGDCNKIVTTYAVFCIGGELIGYRVPPHKTKPKSVKRPKGDRHGARSRRG